jgi:hypothetical protein
MAVILLGLVKGRSAINTGAGRGNRGYMASAEPACSYRIRQAMVDIVVTVIPCYQKFLQM